MRTKSETDQLIRLLDKQGKTHRQIATFLGVSLLKVKGILDKDHIRKKQEAATALSFKRALMRQEIVYADRIPQPQGRFLASQEGQETLERINAPYQPTGGRF